MLLIAATIKQSHPSVIINPAFVFVVPMICPQWQTNLIRKVILFYSILE
jgi:hypothetical protein